MAQLRQDPMLGSPEEMAGRISAIHADGQRKTATEISDEAERFAKGHGLWPSLLVLKSLVTRHDDLVSTVKVDLLADAEVSNWFTLCFCLRTSAGVLEVLELDNRLRDLMIESIPADDLIYLAIRFQFDPQPDANGF
jgi:hypothetical protein